MGFEGIFASIGQAIIAFLVTLFESAVSPFVTGIFGEPEDDNSEAIEVLLNS